jgi:hypothetical protein
MGVACLVPGGVDIGYWDIKILGYLLRLTGFSRFAGREATHANPIRSVGFLSKETRWVGKDSLGKA